MKSQPHGGCVVIGGTMVAPRGKDWFIQRRMLGYLEELADEFGSVVFFAAVAPASDAGTVFQSRVPTRIQIEPITVGKASIASRVGGPLALSRRLAKTIRKHPCVVHFFPAALGPLGTTAIRNNARAHLTYFKSDWIKWTNAREGKQLQALYWSISQRYEARCADAAVFRDSEHMARIKHWFHGPTELAQPILATPAPHASNQRRDTATERKLRILFVGLLAPQKGLADLAAAVRLLEASEPKVPPYEVILVGGPPAGTRTNHENLPDWLSLNLEREGVSARFHATGFVDDPAALSLLYTEADLLVLPSWTEGFPRVIDEAMAHALAIVTTPVGGIPAILRDGRDAVFVAPHAPKALALALAELLSSATRRAELGRRARESYDRRVTSSAAQQHARLLRAAWERNG